MTSSRAERDISSDAGSRLWVARFRSIHEIDETLWDSVNASQDLFHTHRFMKSVEDAEVENSRFWYLLFYSEETPVGTAALSSFIISLDLLVEGVFKKLIRFLRQRFPNLLTVRILCCGLPISIGKNALTISAPSLRDGILKLLVQEMDEIGRKEDIRFQCLKEFLGDEISWADRLRKYHFLRLHSMPYMSMKIRWKHFRAYLDAMRHNYRRHVLRSLRKLGQSEPLIQTWSSYRMNSDMPALVLANPSVCSPQKFYELYSEVMNHAKVKLETLNKSFFENICRNMDGDIELLAVVKEKQILAVALLSIHTQKMTFLLAGLNYSALEEYDAYFNLIYGIVSLAIRRGCARLDLGQTPYWLKQCIGGKSTPLYFYIRAERWHLHWCLRIFHPILFPEMKLPSIHVFKE
jgi:predicted N-acyltransferase